jgi:hypothetical protein
MTEIVIRRGDGYRDLLRSYRILVDGKDVAKIRRNSERRLPVSPGSHRVQLRIDWMGSPELQVFVDSGDHIVLLCGPNPAFSTSALSILRSDNSYVKLELLTPYASASASASTEDVNDRDSDRESDPRSSPPHGTAMPWYEVLMVSPDATIEEVRDAYRRLIGQYHPDKVIRLGEEIRQLAVRKSQEINVAYETARRQMGQSA